MILCCWWNWAGGFVGGGGLFVWFFFNRPLKFCGLTGGGKGDGSTVPAAWRGRYRTVGQPVCRRGEVRWETDTGTRYLRRIALPSYCFSFIV